MSSVDIKLDGLSVMIGIPAGRDLHPYTVKSLISTFVKMERLKIPCQLGMIVGCSIVTQARDEVLDLFLQSDANRLFWIDSDMCWTENEFVRLLALSKVREVVCATYPAKCDPPTFFVNHDSSAHLTQQEYGLIEVYGVGMGFACMTREPLEKLAATKTDVFDQVSKRNMKAVFRAGIINGNRQGEDMAFFNDIRDLGYKVWLDPEVRPSHIGMKIYEGSIKDAMKFD